MKMAAQNHTLINMPMAVCCCCCCRKPLRSEWCDLRGRRCWS